MKGLLLVVCLLGASTAAYGAVTGDSSTGRLQKQCRKALAVMKPESGSADSDLDPELDFYSVGHCTGYVTGFIELYKTLVDDDMLSDPAICFPENLDTEQAWEVFLKWVDDHPDMIREHRMWGLAGSFSEAFPCKEGENP